MSLVKHPLQRRSSSKLSVAKIESVSLSHGHKKDDSSLFHVTNSLLPTTTKIKKIRRRTTEEDLENHRHEHLKKGLLMVHSNESIFSSSSLPDTDPHDLMRDYLGRRRRSNTLPEPVGPVLLAPVSLLTAHQKTRSHEFSTTSSAAVDVISRKEFSSSTEKIKPISLNIERKSKSVKKLRELVGKVLRKNLEHCRYDAKKSRKRCTHLSQILETTLKSSLNSGEFEYKVVALVYIGEFRDDGMKQSCQYFCNPVSDLCVMEHYRGEDMFATGIVFATLVESQKQYLVPSYNNLQSSRRDPVMV
ncbi:dynein light chain Tctex-type 5-B-like [Clytia hemisphaerica]|uniref:Uncharacterized protein n=2 Tax=Clytia hemisphaerica TaxID=252671 RepID=A0A7M5VH96_9CNID|eukprot:TCONS_00011361-protein